MASTDFLKLLLMQIVSNQPLKARYLSVYYVLAVKNASAEIIKSISNYMNRARYFRKNSELNKHVPHFKHMIPPRSSFALGPIVPLPRSSLPICAYRPTFPHVFRNNLHSSLGTPDAHFQCSKDTALNASSYH